MGGRLILRKKIINTVRFVFSFFYIGTLVRAVIFCLFIFFHFLNDLKKNFGKFGKLRGRSFP